MYPRLFVDFVICLVFVAFLLVLLGVVLFINFQRNRKERFQRRHTGDLESRIYTILLDAEGATESLWFLLESKGAMRNLAREVMLFIGRDLKGDLRIRLGELFDDLGMLGEEMARLNKRSWRKRGEAAFRLGEMHHPRAVDALIDLLQDTSAEVRLAACRALGELQDPRAVGSIILTLADSNSWAKMKIADTLLNMKTVAEQPLISLLHDSPLPARKFAIRILGEMRSLHGRVAIIPLLESPDKEIRLEAARAVGQIGFSFEVLPQLLSLLHDPDWQVRAIAAQALGRVGEKRAVSPLATALADSQYWVRQRAAEALGNLGEEGRRALELIEKLAGEVSAQVARQQLFWIRMQPTK